MNTKGDDYPIHQLPIPVAEVGTERNFYDRYFFNGYNEDGSIFFATALCVYPNLNLIDGSFVLVFDDIQHNFRYSDILNQERLDTSVGALKVKVIEPLKVLRIEVNDKDKDIQVELNFEGRFEPMQEPRMTMKSEATKDEDKQTDAAYAYGVVLGGDYDSGGGVLYIYNPTNPNLYTFTSGQGASGYETGAGHKFRSTNQIGVLEQTNNITGINFVSPSASNDFKADVRVYGIRDS